MQTFKDTQGREWCLAINIAAIKRVKSLIDVNLLDTVDGKLIERFVTDPVLLCDVIFCIIKPDADAKQITDEDFGAALAGDAIEAATTALLEELVEFFPNPKRRVLAKALGKIRDVEAKAIELAEKQLQSPLLDKKIEAALNELGATSGNLPASLASTPTL